MFVGVRLVLVRIAAGNERLQLRARSSCFARFGQGRALPLSAHPNLDHSYLSAVSCHLFISQRNHRIDFGRPASGQITREQSNSGQDDGNACKGRGIGRFQSEKH